MSNKSKKRPLLDKQKEVNLVQRIQAGDKKAEAQLFESYYDEILTLIEMRLFKQNHRELESIASDVCLTLLVNIREGKYKTSSESSVLGYVYGIVNIQMRKLSREIKKKNKQEPIKDINKLKDLTSQRRLENQQIRQSIQIILQDLKPKYSYPYLLRFQEYYSVRDIANVLDVPASEVSNRLKYAKDLVLKELKKRNVFPDNTLKKQFK